jgi:hypothetical protein
MAAATNALPEVGLVQPARRRRQFIDENATPLGALVWRTARQKAKLFDQWRVAIGKLFPSSARVLRVAWALEWLFGQEGFYEKAKRFDQRIGLAGTRTRFEQEVLSVAQALRHRGVGFTRGNQRWIRIGFCGHRTTLSTVAIAAGGGPSRSASHTNPSRM